MNNPFAILFKYPSRERPERFFEGMDSIYRNLSDLDNFHISCTLDDNDASMNNPEVIERIASYKNTSIAWGKSESKIHAFNRDMPDYDFDILVAMSDDIRFNIFGFDEMLRVDMNFLFPIFDGLLHYNDQDAKEALAVLYVAGRKWWEYRNKNIYSPAYRGFWCDNEEMEVAKILKKYHYCGYQILDHLCPGWGRAPKDEMYLRQDADWGPDQQVFNDRKLINFGL